MQYLSIALSLFAAVSMAAPLELVDRQVYLPCAGLSGNAQCCATDVLGLADLDCAGPPEVPTSAANFSAVCSAIGQRARCCALPVLGQALICATPVGVED
jgi:hypothetical protein